MHNLNKKNEKRLPNSMFRILTFVVVCAAVALLLLFNSGIFAKYIHQDEQDSLYVAEKFYFESDYLKLAQDNGQYVSHTLQTGVNEITFELRNYGDNLRSSEVDIAYKIYLNGTEQTDKSGKLLCADEDGKVLITMSGLAAGKHLITATSTAPYSTTIGAEFVVVDESVDIEYSAYGSADSPLMLLTVKTNDYAGNVQLVWDGKNVYPDKTDPMLETAVASTGSHTVSLAADSEYTFKFFKSNLNTDYTSTLGANATNNNN